MDDVQLKDLFILQGVGFFTRISVSLEKMRADGELSLDQFEKIIDFVKKAVRDMPDFYKFLDDLSEPDQLSADKIRKAIQRGTVKGVLTTLTQ